VNRPTLPVAPPLPKPSIIVVTSHVARGGVGGRVAVFALERLGFPVISVPSVLFPWHLGHGRATRLLPESASFEDFLADLARAPWLGEVGGVLTGYLGDAAQAASIARLVAAVKARNPAALYLCDPVIGDSEGLFVPEALAEAIRGRLLPLADIATPNRHELAWYEGRPAEDNDGLIEAARRLGPKEVVVTSAFAPPGEIGNLSVTPGRVDLITHRALASVPHGTGDLLAALHLGHRLSGAPAAEALGRAVAATLRLIDLAAEMGADELPLAAGQDAFLAAPSTGLTLTRL
jgi:pyridoxine kinase